MLFQRHQGARCCVAEVRTAFSAGAKPTSERLDEVRATASRKEFLNISQRDIRFGGDLEEAKVWPGRLSDAPKFSREMLDALVF
jgi:hypothetical protein